MPLLGYVNCIPEYIFPGVTSEHSHDIRPEAPHQHTVDQEEDHNHVVDVENTTSTPPSKEDVLPYIQLLACVKGCISDCGAE